MSKTRIGWRPHRASPQARDQPSRVALPLTRPRAQVRERVLATRGALLFVREWQSLRVRLIRGVKPACGFHSERDFCQYFGVQRAEDFVLCASGTGLGEFFELSQGAKAVYGDVYFFRSAHVFSSSVQW